MCRKKFDENILYIYSVSRNNCLWTGCVRIERIY